MTDYPAVIRARNPALWIVIATTVYILYFVEMNQASEITHHA